MIRVGRPAAIRQRLWIVRSDARKDGRANAECAAEAAFGKVSRSLWTEGLDGAGAVVAGAAGAGPSPVKGLRTCGVGAVNGAGASLGLVGAVGCGTLGRFRLLGSMPSTFTRSTTEEAPRSRPASKVSTRLRMKKTEPRIQVVRVSRSPAPRAVMKPVLPPPIPRAPPSERCNRTTAISEMQTMTWMVSRMPSSIDISDAFGRSPEPK